MSSDLLQSVVPTLYRTFAQHLAELLEETGRVPDLATAEDVVQDCFTALTEHPEIVAGVRNHKAWLTTMAVNRALNLCKAPRLKKLVPLELGESVEAPETEDLLPDETLERFACDLKSAMEKLTPRQSAVVSLHVLQRFTLAEVATLLDLSKATVSQHYQTALKNLRQELAGSRAQTCAPSRDSSR
ncbi:MAG: sigma-70 family RNA polymerase sigma factor [Planctomycetes bacterium]|nr:sigma-70 family RNA polymerase sigma factor [Planctomycetota bacterium]